ncbi:hypothetical protein I4U23_020171 [Adineta vaga]|nr:hypothetical protein I4U23_020171 [Adineta vaga]
MTQNKTSGSVQNTVNQKVDYVCKLLIIGNSSVGKTSLLFRYTDNTFSSAFITTLGVDFKSKILVRHDKCMKLQIWDTAGQERHRSSTTVYYRGALGFILVYDITNEESFRAVKDWVSQIETYSYEKPAVILIGNKCDMTQERVVPTEHGKKLADELGLEFFEISVKDNVNVQTVFEKLADVILEKISQTSGESIDTGETKLYSINRPGAYVLETTKIIPSNYNRQTEEEDKRCLC